MKNDKDEMIELDEFKWNDLEHKEKQAKFQENLKRCSEIVEKWPELKRNVLGIIDWKYK